MLRFVGAAPQQVHVPQSRRREFRGNAHMPTLDRQLVSAWIPSFERVRAGIPDVCDDVATRFEHKLLRFGYSLRNLRRLHDAPALRGYLVAPEGSFLSEVEY